MKIKTLLLALVATAVAVASCQQEEPNLGFPSLSLSRDSVSFEQPAAEDTLTFLTTRAWTAKADKDWIAIDPDHGSASSEKSVITITVFQNESYDRTGTVKISIGFTEMEVYVSQLGTGSPDQKILFFNDFDKAAATQTFGSGTSWPYLDQFDGWKNQKGTGLDSLSYAFNAVSARNNSNSNGTYSDYEGSGVNNLLFGANGWFAVKDILTNGNTDIKLSFGTEKYDNNDKTALFDAAELPVYVSSDNAKWVPLNYQYLGTAAGRWNTAECTFTVPEGTKKLSVLIQAKVASSYRVDDLRLEAADDAGQAIDFSTGTDIDISGGSGTGGEDDPPTPPTPVGDAIYSNNFDKAEATKTYGSGSSYPFLDQFDGWNNGTGSGSSSVTYNFNAVTARNNSVSNSQYSNYAGSGMNNLFFGSSAWFAVKNITLGGVTDIAFTFGSEKYLQSGSSTFTNSEFPVYASIDNQKWVSLVYTYKGTKDGTWDTASGTFSVPAGTTKVSFLFKPTVASAYRLDDFAVSAAAAAGTLIDFSAGETIDTGESSGDEPGIPGGEAIFSQNFKTAGQGNFTIHDASQLPDGLSYVWKYDSKYGMKASAYVNNTKYAAESWVISPEIDLTSEKAATIEFEHTGRYFGTIANEAELMVSKDGGTNWTKLAIPNFPSQSDWTFVSSGKISLASFVGSKIKFAFKYTSTTSAAGTWEIQSVTVSRAASQDDGGTGGGTGGETGGETGGDQPAGNSIKISALSTGLSWNKDTDATYGAGFKGTGSGLTVAYYKNTGTAPVEPDPTFENIKLYQNCAFMVSLDGGKTIKSIKMVCAMSGSSYCADLSVTDGTTAKADTSAKTITWTGSTTKFIAIPTKQVRPISLEVIYE